jgi:hypothetical protein
VPAAHVLTDAIEIAATVARDAALDGPHVVTGPIFVEGAEVGDLLKITVVDLAPRVPYGSSQPARQGRARRGAAARAENVSVFTPVSDGRGILPSSTGASASCDSRSRRSSARWASPSRATSAPTRCPRGARRQHRHQPARGGAVLYLPVQVAGALAYVGDPHFAQGDGEVALTALEASLRATLRFDVVPRARRSLRSGR